MKESYQQLVLINNTDKQRFELDVENETAFLEYSKKADAYILIHTEVPESLGGKGAAAALVEKVFVFMKENKFQIILFCPYVVAYLNKHPEWNFLVK